MGILLFAGAPRHRTLAPGAPAASHATAGLPSPLGMSAMAAGKEMRKIGKRNACRMHLLLILRPSPLMQATRPVVSVGEPGHGSWRQAYIEVWYNGILSLAGSESTKVLGSMAESQTTGGQRVASRGALGRSKVQ